MSLSYESSGRALRAARRLQARLPEGGAHGRRPAGGHGYREPATVRGRERLPDRGRGPLTWPTSRRASARRTWWPTRCRRDGRCFYRAIGIDTVATIANDLVTCGALPIAVAMHAAVGDSGWFSDERRAQELVAGFAEGCRPAGAVWGGGETPALRGLIEPGAIVLAGSAVGRIAPKSLRIVGDVSRRRRDHLPRLLGRADQRAHALPEDRREPAGGLPDPHRGRDDLGEALLAPRPSTSASCASASAGRQASTTPRT
jgi:phosphoribosylformylglycinamidine cyclo-ligase